jgi:hypothetical protein
MVLADFQERLVKSLVHNLRMKSNSIRTFIDRPRDLHRRLHEAAARKGCSARKLILARGERAVGEAKASRPSRQLSLDPPLIRPTVRRITVTNEEAYELLSFPDINVWPAIATPEHVLPLW